MVSANLNCQRPLPNPEIFNAFEINFWNCFGCSCVPAMYLSEMCQIFHLNGNYNLMGIQIKVDLSEN